MRYLLFFMLLVAVFVLGKRSCHFSGFGINGSGPEKTEVRNVNGFHAIDMNISGDVEVSIGDYHVEVVAQENLLPILKTEVKDGVLEIYFDESVSFSNNIKLKITAPAFDAFDVSGSGEIRAISPIQGDKMDISIGGSGDVILPQCSFESLNCSISGSGNMELSGHANKAKVSVTGSGEIAGQDMAFNELEVQVSGSGTVYAHVEQLLDVSVSGSGDVFYTGSPSVTSSISGSGSVTKSEGDRKSKL